MWQGVVAELVHLIVGIGMILAFLNSDWFENYIEKLASLTYFIVMLSALVLYGFVVFFWKGLKGVPKAVIVCAVMVALAVIYILTLPVPKVSRKTKELQQRIPTLVKPDRLYEAVDRVRSELVGIATEHDPPTPEFDSEKKYREELVEIREEASDKLERGETILTQGIAGILVVTTLLDIQLFSVQFYGHSLSLLLELFVLLVAISILYRTALLDLVAYTGEEEFTSLEEMEIAVTYQRAVSVTKIAQSMAVLLVAVTTLAPSKFGAALPAIEKRYNEDLTFIQTMEFAWSKLRAGTLFDRE